VTWLLFAVVSTIIDGIPHHYQIITTQASWQTARQEASAARYQGMQGYLATITSQQEHAFIANMLAIASPAGAAGMTWMGLHDWPHGSHNFMWADGPVGEAGVVVYTGLAPQGGHAVDAHFTAWAYPQPDEFNGNEFCGQYWDVDWRWNDEACEHEYRYLIEYTNCTFRCVNPIAEL